MPHWQRNSIVALLAGLAAGCGSSGLYWVDAKLSRLSTPHGPVVDAGNRTTSLREMSAAKPSDLPETRPAMTSVRLDKEDASVVSTPLKAHGPLPPRNVESEPVAPKPMSRRDGPVPAAFALATSSRPIREDEKADHDAAWDKMTAESDVIPFADAEVGRKTPVTLASRKGNAETESNESAAANPVNPIAAASNEWSENQEPTVAASPIPKAVAAHKLSIANVTLCREIQGFGKTTPIAGPLKPGGQALVYMETSGQASKATAAGVETRYRGKLRLAPQSGGPTTEWEFEDIVDVVKEERTQFFCHLLLSLPESLSEGEYRLEAVLEDVHGGSAASEKTSLRIEPATTPAK